jgi:hypothetical protein
LGQLGYLLLSLLYLSLLRQVFPVLGIPQLHLMIHFHPLVLNTQSLDSRSHLVLRQIRTAHVVLELTQKHSKTILEVFVLGEQSLGLHEDDLVFLLQLLALVSQSSLRLGQVLSIDQASQGLFIDMSHS